MPNLRRRLGRIPTLVTLTAVLAITGAWTPSPRWTSDVLSGPHGDTAPVAGVEALTDVPTPPELDTELLASVRDTQVANLQQAAADAAAAAAAAAEQKPEPKPAPKKEKASPAPKKTATYSGRNHLWIPALGVSQNIVWFPCERQKPPGPYTYRWGCAGHNNVYILGHASGVMKPLHDAYVSGRLKVGMVAYYANPNGVVRKYKVKFWKITEPVGTTQWWIAPQPVPSLTLQTCYGRDSQYRLKVRLVAVD